MTDGEDPAIADAMAKLEAEDVGVARGAEAAPELSTANEGLEVIELFPRRHEWLTAP